jgi:predicted peptidase
MSSIVLMVREPDLFAGAMLVAGQWDPDVMGPLAENNLWILVCEGDQKASSGMNAAVAIWEEDGAVISKATWDPLATKTEQTANVDALRAENTNIKYIKFIGGSHTYTWQIAYSIEGVRDWLFSQVKGENKE